MREEGSRRSVEEGEKKVRPELRHRLAAVSEFPQVGNIWLYND